MKITNVKQKAKGTTMNIVDKILLVAQDLKSVTNCNIKDLEAIHSRVISLIPEAARAYASEEAAIREWASEWIVYKLVTAATDLQSAKRHQEGRTHIDGNAQWKVDSAHDNLLRAMAAATQLESPSIKNMAKLILN